MPKGNMLLSKRIERAKSRGNQKLLRELLRLQKAQEEGGRVMIEEQNQRLAQPPPTAPVETILTETIQEDVIGLDSLPPQPQPPTVEQSPVINTLEKGLQGQATPLSDEETEGLALLLEMSLPELLKIKIFDQTAEPVDGKVVSLWSKYVSKVVQKRTQKPLTPEMGAILLSAVIFAPRLNFEKLKPAKKEPSKND